jgi:hypothetical protein
MLGGRTTPAYFFFFFFLKNNNNKIKYAMRPFWKKKKVKMVELQQFESLGG